MANRSTLPAVTQRSVRGLEGRQYYRRLASVPDECQNDRRVRSCDVNLCARKLYAKEGTEKDGYDREPAEPPVDELPREVIDRPPDRHQGNRTQK